MLGKHLRKLASIRTSVETLKFTFNAKILTLGTMDLGVTFVRACKCNPRFRHIYQVVTV